MKSKREVGKKGERKSPFLVCFFPAADDADTPAKAAGSDPVLAVIAVSKENLIPVIVQPKTKQSPATNSDSCGQKTSRRFSGFKSAIFGNAKRVRSGKVQQEPRRSSGSSERVSDEPVTAVKPTEVNRKPAVSLVRKTDSNPRTPSSSSSQCSVFGRSKNSSSSSRRRSDSPTSSAESRNCKQSSSPRSNGRRTLIPTGKLEAAPNRIVELCCLLAFSLWVTLIWGRISAILWTSIWLCLSGLTRVRNSSGNGELPESPADPPEIHSWDYRKRVIMEGFLGRSHQHHHHRAPLPRQVGTLFSTREILI